MPDPAYSQERDPENENGCSCFPTVVSDEKVRDDAREGYFPEFRLTFSLSGFFLLLLRIYKLCISPFLPRCCRFHPSCSAYAAESVLKHGAVKGCFLALFRLLRCHPFCKGGYDPVPEKFFWKELFCGKTLQGKNGKSCLTGVSGKDRKRENHRSNDGSVR